MLRKPRPARIVGVKPVDEARVAAMECALREFVREIDAMLAAGRDASIAGAPRAE